MSKFKAGDIAWLMIEDEEYRLQAVERVVVTGPCDFPGGDWMIEQQRTLAHGELPTSKAWSGDLCTPEELPRLLLDAGKTPDEIDAECNAEMGR